jgi:signal transduction histidine kinase
MIVLGLLVTTGWGSGQGSRSLTDYVLIELLADGAAAAVFVIAALTVMRPRPARRVPVMVVVGVWTLIGLVRALVLDRFYVEGVVQIVSATVTLAGWALLIIYVAATIAEERDRATQLRLAHAELLAVRDSTEGLLAAERARLAEAVRQSVSPEITRLRQLVTVLDRPGSTQEITALADSVAAYSTDVVRQASRDIRVDASMPRPVLAAGGHGGHLPTVMQSYARASQPILVPMGLITLRALTVWASQDDLLAAALGLVGLAVVTGAGWWLRSMIDRLLRRPSWKELVASSVLAVGMAVTLMLIFDWAREGVSGPNYVPLPLIVAFVLAVLVAARLVTALELRWRLQIADWERVNDELGSANRKLADEVHVVRDKLAGILHGPVQGRLAAASMALRMYVSALESGGHPDLRETVTMATTLLDRANADIERLGAGGSDEGLTLDDGIRRIASNWSGLLAIDYVIDDAWPRPGELAVDCIDLVSELVTNASRHGDARHVRIRVQGLNAHSLLIESVDDGSGPGENVAEGQGLAGVGRWHGDWRVSRDDAGGARVVLTLRH